MKREKVYDLEERTYQFAKECRLFLRELPKTINNIEDGKQLVKASGSIGANYIEANEKLGDKDFVMRLKIARKEAKEVRFWLRLLNDLNPSYQNHVETLITEATELRKILSAIIKKASLPKQAYS